jgi:nicotinamide-nucleotide amidase
VTAESIIAEATRRHLTIAVAESLTGGLLVADLVAVPGASAVVTGGVVAYATELKHRLLGVDAELLAERGAVDGEVARQLAVGARERLGVAGASASIGISTTGVAGPASADGQPVGTVWIGYADESGSRSTPLQLSGSRGEIRGAAVRAALDLLEAGLRASPE